LQPIYSRCQTFEDGNGVGVVILILQALLMDFTPVLVMLRIFAADDSDGSDGVEDHERSKSLIS